jgi:signal transduction histidine kinase
MDPIPHPSERLLACYRQALGHELPNQLVAIQGLVRLLQLDEADRLSAEARDYLDRLAGLARRAHDLARELAELGRAGPGPAPPADVAEVVAEAAAEVKQLCPGRPFEYHVGGESSSFPVPYLALRQVLVRLLRHAVGVGPPDRPLRVEVQTRPGPELWVGDDGPGLPADTLARVFEPFVPAQAGVGLFAVRHLAEAWGGTARVRSEPGRGTTFVLTAPTRRDEG